MLFKSTLRLMLVETDKKQLLLPVVSNSYKKTLWLLLHREPSAKVVGIIEGPVDDMSFLQVGEVDIPNIHASVMRATNVLYTAIGREVEVPATLDIDYSLYNLWDINDIKRFVIKYSAVFTPDELLVILGVGHVKLFKAIGELVISKTITYVPENGPNKWSFYDYYWLHEKYKLVDVKELDIRPYINRSSLQIKFRAHSVGFTKRQQEKKKAVATGDVALIKNIDNTSIVLNEVERDYMLTQIEDIVSTIVGQG